MVVTQFGGRCGHETGQRVDEHPRLGEVGFDVFGQTNLHGCGAHEVYRDTLKDLDRGHLGDVEGGVVLGEIGVRHETFRGWDARERSTCYSG